MLKMRKYDQYKQDKITAEQYQAFVEEVYIKKEQLEDKLKQLYEEQNAMKTSYKEAEHTHLLANSMLFRNSYDAEIISRFVKYIDVYSECLSMQDLLALSVKILGIILASIKHTAML